MLWPHLRGVASWIVGVWWGNVVIHDSGPTDWGNVIMVMGCLALPVAQYADELRQRVLPPPEIPAVTANGAEHREPSER